MSRFSAVPDGTPRPFSETGQTFQEFCDRAGALCTSNNFLSTMAVRSRGVLVSSPRVFSGAQHKRLYEGLEKVSDRSGSASLLTSVKFERKHTKSDRWLPRAGSIFSGAPTISRFIAHLFAASGTPSLVRGFDIRSNGLYWSSRGYAIPYIDIDMPSVYKQASFSFVWTQVHGAYKRLAFEFKALGAPEEEANDCRIFYNCREDGDETNKHSFHIHWPRLCFSNNSDLAHVVHKANGNLRGQRVLREAANIDEEVFSTKPIMDTAVYSRADQLFRLPFCGKFGASNTSLTPLISVSGEASDGVLILSVDQMSEEEVAQHILSSRTHTDEVGGRVLLEVPMDDNAASVPHHALPAQGVNAVVPIADENPLTRAAWLGFWLPIIKEFIIPGFVRVRQQKMSQLKVNCPSPSADSVKISSLSRIEGYPASYQLVIEGDAFCEYDRGGTAYQHKLTKAATTVVVDLFRGRIAQQCRCCQGYNLQWYQFIQHGRLSFNCIYGPHVGRECGDTVTAGKSEPTFPFLVRYFKDWICFSEVDHAAMVYDRIAGIWVCGSRGNRILIHMIDSLNNLYKDYIRARNGALADNLEAKWRNDNRNASADERKKALDKITNDCWSANADVPNLIVLPATTRETALRKLECEHIPHRVLRMEPDEYKIPIKGGMYLDLYTWTIHDSTPRLYFTSHFNATIIDMRDDSIGQINDWQRMVCCGDEDVMNYKYSYMGLSFTMMNFDRSFYVAHGPRGREGKGSEFYLLNNIAMRADPPRGTNIPREYLCVAAQNKKSASAPDVVMMNLKYKTVALLDEVPKSRMDGELVKTLTSGDDTQARNNYQSETSSIKNAATLLMACNLEPNFDHSDQALVEREKLIRYHARWVRPNQLSQVRDEVGMQKAMHVHEEDPMFKQNFLLPNSDAFFTRCLYQLHLHLKKMPADPENSNKPSSITSFPVPASVTRDTREHAAKHHPIGAFIKKHLGKTCDRSAWLSLAQAFEQFRRFSKINNDNSIRFMDMGKFEDALRKEGVEVERKDNEDPLLDSYMLVKEIPLMNAGFVADSF